jgi:hypothetical protein
MLDRLGSLLAFGEPRASDPLRCRQYTSGRRSPSDPKRKLEPSDSGHRASSGAASHLIFLIVICEVPATRRSGSTSSFPNPR